MSKAVYFVLAVLPLALVLLGVAGYVPDVLVLGKTGGIPSLVVILLALMAWSVVLAVVFLKSSKTQEDDG